MWSDAATSALDVYKDGLTASASPPWPFAQAKALGVVDLVVDAYDTQGMREAAAKFVLQQVGSSHCTLARMSV